MLYSFHARIIIIGLVICQPFLSYAQGFWIQNFPDCIQQVDYLDCSRFETITELCELDTILNSGAGFYYSGSMSWDRNRDTLYFMLAWIVNVYDRNRNEMTQNFSRVIQHSGGRYPGEQFIDFIVKDRLMYMVGKHRYGIYDPFVDTLSFRYLPYEAWGQNSLVKYKDYYIGVKNVEVDSVTGNTPAINNQVLFRYEPDDFLSGPSKIMELEEDAIIRATNFSPVTAAQLHCEDVRLYYLTPDGRFVYFYPDSPTIHEECADFPLIGPINAIDFPEWSDCMLSIDLDLGDEAVQYNRDYSDTLSCDREIAIVDDDVQVFASVGNIDSIVIYIETGSSLEVLAGLNSNNIKIDRNNSRHVSLVSNGLAEFDEYEGVLRSLRYTQSGHSIQQNRQIHFQAFYQGQSGLISTTYLHIMPNPGTIVTQDTTIMICSETMQISVADFLPNSFTPGSWSMGDSILAPAIEGSKLFQYIHTNQCYTDTSFFEFIVGNLPTTRAETISICTGDSIQVYGQWYSEAGMVEDTIRSELGRCDSIYSMTTIVLSDNPIMEQSNLVLCQGDSLNVNGTWYDATVTVLDTVTDVSGCDSIVTTTNILLSPSIIEETLSYHLCRGDTFMLEDQKIVEAGIYINEIESLVSGCDSLVQIWEVTISQQLQVESMRAHVCLSDSIMFADAWLSQSGSYSDTIMGALDCDSLVVILELSVSPAPEEQRIDKILCPGESIVIDDSVVTEAGVYSSTDFNVEGCDSIIYEYNVREENISSDLEDYSVDVTRGDTVELALFAPSEFISYNWSPPEGLTCSACSAPQVVADTDINYTVSLISLEGCSFEIRADLRVRENERQFEEKYYLPNAVSRHSSEDMSQFYLQGSENSEITYDLNIYDRWGNLMFETTEALINDSSAGWNISRSDVLPGVYVYRIITDTGNNRAGTLTVF